MLVAMLRTSLMLVCLIGASALPCPAQDERATPDEEAVAARIAAEIRRLQGAVERLAPEPPQGESDSGAEKPVDDVTLRLLALRQEIDQILILLEAQPPVVRRRVGQLLAAETEARGTPPVTPEPAAEAESPPEAVARIPEPRAEPQLAEADPPCAELAPFDSNGDGVLSGLDRYWRYFRLWRDDGDGTMEERELRGLYDSGVGELTLRLGTYRTVDGDAGDVLDDGTLGLDLPGREGIARLTLDADRLARGGELELRGADGAPLSGRQVLTPEMIVAAADGRTTALYCSR